MIQPFVSFYVHHQMRVFAPQLSDCRSVLDFGCGDMALDRLLITRHPALTITGIDVMPFSIPKQTGLKFFVYKGDTLPFGNRSFDAVFSYHVFHHTKNPFFALSECARVCKNMMIIVEPVLRYSFEKTGFTILDFWGHRPYYDDDVRTLGEHTDRIYDYAWLMAWVGFHRTRDSIFA